MTVLVNVDLHLEALIAFHDLVFQVIRFVVVYRGDLPTHLFQLAAVKCFFFTRLQRLLQFLFVSFRRAHTVPIAILGIGVLCCAQHRDRSENQHSAYKETKKQPFHSHDSASLLTYCSASSVSVMRQTALPRPMNKLMRKSTMKMTNKAHAISVAIPATPVNPRTAAIRPIIKNVIDQLSMVVSSFLHSQLR